jgi:hypothetical protein
MLIISIGCLAALVMQSSALKGNNLSDNLTVATFLAESELERMKSLTYEELKAEADGAVDYKITKYLNRKSEKCTGTTAEACAAFPFTMEINFFPKFPTTHSTQTEIQVDWMDNTGKHEVFYSTVFTDLVY